MSNYLDGMEGGKHNSDDCESKSPRTQEIRITAQITLEVSTELSKEQLTAQFSGAQITIWDANDTKSYSRLEIIEIEEEAEIYGNE